jgi:hypothetical protein
MSEYPGDMAGLKKLREPFPADWISKLPKPTKRENPKGKCIVCGGWHGLPAVHIDYVGHADLTARLLDVDPLWNWKPLALTPEGLPLVSVVSGTASMWIELTVCGMTRLGVGTAPANKEDVLKELVGDALRNSAMRFGAALDLWSKTERSDTTTAHEAPEPVRTARRTPPVKPPEPTPALEPDPRFDVSGSPEAITKPQLTKMHILFKEKGINDRTDALNYLTTLGILVQSSKELSKDEADRVIESLMRLANPA